MRKALGFSALLFWPYFRSGFSFSNEKFRFWCLLVFAVCPFLSNWFSVLGKNTSDISDWVSDLVFHFSCSGYLSAHFKSQSRSQQLTGD